MFSAATAVPAQPGETKDTLINTILKRITSFQQQESKRDSVLNHPLGSNTEEDFARRNILMIHYIWY